MANRYVRNLAVLAELEVTYGTDPTPLPAANGILISDANINPLNAQNVDRDLVRAYFGASEQLVGVSYVEMDFKVELAGSGVAGTAPAWGPLARACLLAEDVEATYVAYTPITDGQESVTIYWYDSGLLHIARGCRGTMQLMAKVTERPMMAFAFKGLLGSFSAATVPLPAYVNWIKPLVVTDTNTNDLTLGAALAAGAITGGTPYPSTGLEIDFGIQNEFIPLVGGETVDGVDRKVTGKIELDLTAPQEVAFGTDVRNNTLRAVSMQHGTVAGNIVLVHCPSVQFTNWRKAELQKKRLIGYDMTMVPLVGNDEITVIVK
jgi:hypothetical protein